MSRARKVRPMAEKCIACDGSGNVDGQFMKACPPCLGTGNARLRCPQCWAWRTTSHFMSKLGAVVKRCSVCRETYKDWDKKTPQQKANATTPRKGIREDGPLRVSFVLESGNSKTGPIPVTMTSAGTCPKSCALYNNGCYAEQHFVAIHWRRLSAGAGLTWGQFVDKVDGLPAGQVWRHNEAGDLPGLDSEVDVAKVRALIEANMGKRGFTCESCKLCAVGHRKSVIGFPAHGDRKGLITNRLRQLPMFKEARGA